MTWAPARALCLAVGVAAVPQVVRAQDAGLSRAGVLLTLATDTRALGLAQAAAASAADEWSTFYAPAQLGRVRRAGLGIATESYLAATQLSAAAVALPVARGTIGIGATLLDYGTIQEIASSVPGTDGVETGREYSAQDYAIIVGYGLGVSSAVRIGGAIEFIGTRLADLSGNGTAFSAGVAGTTAGGWDFAAAAQHIGANIVLGATSGALPATARVSAAAPARTIRSVTIRPMFEGRAVRGAGSAAAVAAEATWRGSRGTGVAVRAGYTVRGGSNDDRWPVSVGVGATLGSVAIDYATQRFPTIDQVTHRIGLRLARSGATSNAVRHVRSPPR